MKKNKKAIFDYIVGWPYKELPQWIKDYLDEYTVGGKNEPEIITRSRVEDLLRKIYKINARRKQ